MKRTILFGLIVLVAVTGLFIWRRSNRNDSNQSAPQVSSATAAKHPDTIRILATGDFIAHDSVNANAKQANGSYDYLPMMESFKPIMAKADIRFCNDPILNGGSQFGISGYPNFNSPTEFVTDMGRLGCNLVNTASNHSFDKTQATIDASVAAWDKVPDMLAVAGQNRSQAEQDKIHYFTIKDTKFAFLAYTTYLNRSSNKTSYGANVYSNELAARQIAEAKQNGAEAIIVSMRWGDEYSPAVNDKQQAQAKFLADQGVTAILGHGPHVLQTVDQVKGSGGNTTTVWYSLGNFLNTQEEAEALFNGIAVMDYDIASKTITKLQYLPIYMHYEWTAEQKQAGNLLARKNLKLYSLDETTQDLIDKNQLKTTVSQQRDRIKSLINKNLDVSLTTQQELLNY